MHICQPLVVNRKYAGAYTQDLRWRVIFLTEIIGIDEVVFLLQISEKTYLVTLATLKEQET